MTTMQQLSMFNSLSPHLYKSFSHNNVCPDQERRALELRYSNLFHQDNRFNRQTVSFQANKEAILHSWIKYREGFSAQLVNTLLDEFNVVPGETVLEPFAGSSTTLLIAKLRDLNADGIELLPNCHLSWEAKKRYNDYDIDELRTIAQEIENAIPSDAGRGFPHIVITQSAFEPTVEREIMFYTQLFDEMNISENAKVLMRLIVTSILEEVSYTRKDGQYLRWDYRAQKVQERNAIRESQGKATIKKIDKGELPGVKTAILRALNDIISDIAALQQVTRGNGSTQTLIAGNTLKVLPSLPENHYACVITSPPYANRYDYTRTYALELAYLGVDDEIFNLRQELLSCTVESRSKVNILQEHYNSLGALDRYEGYLNCATSNPAFQEINQSLKIRWARGDLNNKGVLPMIEQYLLELTFVFGELYRVCRPGARVAFVNDDVRYGGEIIPIETVTTNLAESIGFTPEKIYVLQQRKGNSSQQMERFGREELRKCITVWRKPD